MSESTRFSLSVENEEADTRRGRPNPSRETKVSGANGDREIFIFPVQLTTSRIGNLTRLIHTLAKCYDLGNLHTCKCGSREFDSYQGKIYVLSSVTESMRTRVSKIQPSVDEL